MAFSNQGFSIREYTWRMRSEDVVKCWPFDDIGTYDNDERKMKSFLPQITVKKFRWWFDELQFAISPSNNNNNKKVKRKKGLKRNNDTSVIEEAEESDDDDRVAFKKSKPPKRRSIVELFAVAPPVETLHDDDDNIEVCDSDHDNYDGGIKNANFNRKEKKIRRGHQESRILLMKKFKKDKKQFNMKDMELKEFNIVKKKRSYKAGLHSPVHPTVSSSCSLFDKHHDEDSIGVSLCRKNKPQLKLLAKSKKSKALRTSKLFSDCRKPDSPPQKIVGTRQSNNDDVLGMLREESYLVRCSELHEVDMVNSSVVSLPKDCVQGTREDANNGATKVTGSISSSTKVNFHFEPITEKHLCQTQHSLDTVNIMRDSNVQENSLNRDKGALLTNEHQLYDWGAGPAVSLGDCGQQGNAQLPENASFTSSTFPEFDALLGNNIPNVNELYLKEFATAPLHCSWLSMHPKFVPEAITSNFITNSIPCYPIPHLTPKELIRTICSPLNLKQKELVHEKIRMQENFVGLPLNSQGELIRMNPRCNTVVDQSKISSTIPGKFMGLGTKTDVFSCRAKFSDVVSVNRRRPLKGQVQSCPNKDFWIQNSHDPMSSGLVNLESRLTRKIDIGLDLFDSDSHCNYTFESDSEHITTPQSSQKLDYQTPKLVNNLHIQKNMRPCQVQSTMRLMGKEFTVGENKLQQLENGKVWTDKQIIVETLRRRNDIDNSIGFLGPTESSTKRLLRGTDVSLTHLIDKESGCKQSLPSFHQTQSPPFQKLGFAIQESAKCGYPYLSSHSLTSTHDVLVKDTSSSKSQLRMKVPHETPVLNFPILHSSPIWSLGTPRSWSGDTHKRALMHCLSSFPDSLRTYHSESGSSTNLLKDPSLDKRTFSCFSSPYTLQKPLPLHVSSHCHQIPTLPGPSLDLISHNGYGSKMNPKRKGNSRTSDRGTDRYKITNEWPPMLLEDSTSKHAQKDCPSSEVDTHYGNKEDEPCSFSDVKKAKPGDQVDNCESIDCSSEVISGETNDSARTGPFKLAGGGKQILKAEKTNISSPTSSTIRYVETTGDQNLMRSDEKPVRIYKF